MFFLKLLLDERACYLVTDREQLSSTTKKKNLVVLTAFSFLITLAYINFQDVSVSLQVNANMKGLFKA